MCNMIQYMFRNTEGLCRKYCSISLKIRFIKTRKSKIFLCGQQTSRLAGYLISRIRVFLEFSCKNMRGIFGKNFENVFGDHVQVGGMETGAIALVASIALHAPEGCNVSGFYIRKSRKKSDLANLIEGNVLHNIPIILVDDILNFWHDNTEAG
jgi:hypothetical protein